MDQDTMVSADLAGGWRLIDALARRGNPLDVAYWARLGGEDKWMLYLASPLKEQLGPGAYYQLVYGTLRDEPGCGIDPFSVNVIAPSHPMAVAAAEVVRPRVVSGPFAVPNPKPFRGVTRYGGRYLGGVPVDGVYVYPPWEPGMDPIG
jgi:hypothetical protein